MSSSVVKNITSFDDIQGAYDPANNVSRNVLTKYERTLVIGVRLEQLARGAPPYIDHKKHGLKTIQQVAEKELQERVIPFMVQRTMPDGKLEYWRLSDMII